MIALERFLKPVEGFFIPMRAIATGLFSDSGSGHPFVVSRFRPLSGGNNVKRTHSPERRRHVRSPLESLVGCSGPDVPSPANIEFCADVSMGGVRLEVMSFSPAGRRVCLFFPGNPEVKLTGRVRWRRKRGILWLMGVEFIDMTPAQQECVEAIVASASSSAEGAFDGLPTRGDVP